MTISNERKKELEQVESSLEEWSFPPQVVVETTTYCNMKCIHCNHRVMQRKHEYMEEWLYKKIIDEIAQVAPDTEVWPTFYGEAFTLSEKLFEWLRYARDKGLSKLVLNSNGLLLDRKDWIDQILTSGLKRFIISLDGFTAEIFEKIRVGGKRDKIFNSVEKLIKRKEELGLEYPVIQCQYSLMDENEHEAETFKKFWEEKGAEVKIRQKFSWTNVGDVEAKNLDYSNEFRIACPWVNNTAAIHTNGNLVACAVDYSGGFVAGNVKEQTISEIWTGEHKKKLRDVHKQHRWKELPMLCKNCPDWQCVGAKYYKNEKQDTPKEGSRPFWFNKGNNK